MKNRITQLIYFLYALLLSANLYSQSEVVDPIKVSSTEFGTINSDLGPRYLTEAKKYHSGIDYRCRTGSNAYAVENAVIKGFNEWTKEHAYIIIEGIAQVTRKWRYMHVETDSYTEEQHNRIVWSYHPDFFGTDSEDDDFIFLREVDAIGNLNSIRALTTINYDAHEDEAIDPETGQTISIWDFLYQGDWIFMPRDLDGKAHLHIDRECNLSYINPLADIPYNDTRAPVLEKVTLKRNLNNVATVFEPENEIFGSPIILESKVNTTADKDLDLFSVSCEFENGNTEFSGEWRMTNKPNKPANIKKAVVILSPDMNNEVWIQNNINKGVYPYDPNNTSNAEPGHDYFKLHWPSKQSTVEEQTEAWVNERAEYPDGEYTVTFTAEDITSNPSTETKQVTLDNHKPYVQEVSLFSGNRIYGAKVGYIDPEGANDKGKLKLTVDEQSANDCADFENDLEIFVTTGEAVNEVSIEIPDAGVSGYTLPLVNYYGNPTKWKGVIRKYQLSLLFEYDNWYPVIITGRDKAGNEIVNLGMSENGDEMLATWLPYRDNNGNWVNTLGTGERGHKLYFCSSNWIKANYNARIDDQKNAPKDEDQLYGNSPLDIEFTDASTGEPVEWNWDFGDNSLPVTEQNTSHTFVNITNEPVQYNVSLKACNEGGCDIEVKSKLITVYPEGYENIPIADFTYTQETYSTPYIVRFRNYSVGNIDSFKWNFGDGTTNTSEFEPLHEYYSPGEYNVVLSLNPGTNEQVNYETEIEVLKASSNFSPIDFKWTCIANTDNMLSGEGITGELIDFETTDHFWNSYYEWDMGDGSIPYLTSKPHHAYINTGTYAVKLLIRNFDNELIGQKTKWINVVSNTQIIPPAENEISFPDAAFIKDLEIENDELFVSCCHDENKIFIYKFDGSQWILSSEIPTSGDCYSNITVSNDKMLVGEYYDNNSDKGKVHFYKKINNNWIKQSQILQDTEYNSYIFFGRSISMDNNWVMIHSESVSRGQKMSFWSYNEQANEWVSNPANNKYSYSDRSSISHVKLIGDNAVWDYTYYVLQNDLWNYAWNPIVVEDGSLDSHDPLSETVSFSESHLFSSWDGTLFKYEINENNSLQLLPIFEAPNNININFASSLDVYNNYLICGNNGDINGSGQIGRKGSSFLYRYDENGDLSLYRTYYPQNGIEDDNFGAGVRTNQDHIIIASRGVDNNVYNKAPSFYYYYNYAYFGDRELNIPNFSKYKLNKTSPTRFAARTIDVGGGKSRATVSAGESIELIGQTVTLKPGFSVTGGGEFQGSGTICEDYYSEPEIKIEKSDELKYGINPLGTNSLSKEGDSFTIMPNPTTYKLLIISNSPENVIDRIILFDSFGKKIKSVKNEQKSNAISFTMENFASSLYFISIISSNIVETKKVVKL